MTTLTKFTIHPMIRSIAGEGVRENKPHNVSSVTGLHLGISIDPSHHDVHHILGNNVVWRTDTDEMRPFIQDINPFEHSALRLRPLGNPEDVTSAITGCDTHVGFAKVQKVRSGWIGGGCWPRDQCNNSEYLFHRSVLLRSQSVMAESVSVAGEGSGQIVVHQNRCIFVAAFRILLKSLHYNVFKLNAVHSAAVANVLKGWEIKLPIRGFYGGRWREQYARHNPINETKAHTCRGPKLSGTVFQKIISSIGLSSGGGTHKRQHNRNSFHACDYTRIIGFAQGDAA